MAVSETPRHKLKKYSAGTDPHPGRAVHNGEVDKLEQLPAIEQGSTGSRPLSGVGRVLYWDEAVKRFVYDDGSDWQDVAPIGGVTPTGVAVAGAANEGTSPRAARADHTHPVPLATATAHGAMPSTDKAKLDAAATASTGSTIPLRDSNGNIRFNVVYLDGTSSASNSATPKSYVDAGLSGKSATGHAHVNATTSAPGFMSAADKTKLDVIPTIGSWLDLPISTTSFTPLATNPPKYRFAFGRVELAGSVTCENVTTGEILADLALPIEARPFDRMKVNVALVHSVSIVSTNDSLLVAQTNTNGRMAIATQASNVGKLICLDTVSWEHR